MLVILGAGVLAPFSLSAQTNKEDLPAKRNRIEEQLATTTRLINDAKKNRKAASSQLALIDKQIELREELIRNHQATIRSLEKDQLRTDSKSDHLKDTSKH